MPDEMLHLPVVNSLLERHKGTPGALLPILHDIQERIGYVPDVAVPEIAHALNLSQAEVRGVISFTMTSVPRRPRGISCGCAGPSRARAVAPSSLPRSCASVCNWTITAAVPMAASVCVRCIASAPVPVRRRWSWMAGCMRGSVPSGWMRCLTLAGRTRDADSLSAL